VLDTDWTEAWPRQRSDNEARGSVAFVLAALIAVPARARLEPTKPIEFVVRPTAAAADQMAR